MSKVAIKELPEEWSLSKLGDVVEESQNGLSKRRSSAGNPIHVLRLADIKDGSIYESSPRDILLTENEIDKYLLKEGDLLCIRVNGSRNLTGRMILYRSKDSWAYCDHFIRFKVNQKIADVKYVSHYFDTQIARAYLDKNMVSTAGQNTVSQSTMYGVPIPIAPLEQQKHIVAKIEELFSHIDAGIEALKKAKQLLKQYRQSVLKAAVAGEVMDLKSGMSKFELGEVIKIKSGQNLTKKAMDESGENYVYGGNGISGRHNEYMFQESKLIIGRVGAHCGNVHITKPNSWVTDNAFIVEFDEGKFSMGFLKHLLTSINLNQYSNSTAQPVISGKTIYPVEIVIPEKNDQILLEEYIDQRFDSINRLENEIDSQLLKAVTNKQSVLASAFSGKIAREII